MFKVVNEFYLCITFLHYDDDQRPGQGQVGVPCQAIYHGQSGYSGYTRGLDHASDWRRKVKTNAMWRQSLLYHGAQEVSFSMTVTSTPSDPITRLCTVQGGGLHHRWRPGHPAQLQARVPAKSYPFHQDTERLRKIVLQTQSLLSNILFFNHIV